MLRVDLICEKEERNQGGLPKGTKGVMGAWSASVKGPGSGVMSSDPWWGSVASPLKPWVIYEIIYMHQNETMHFSSNFKLHKAGTK